MKNYRAKKIIKFDNLMQGDPVIVGKKISVFALAYPSQLNLLNVVRRRAVVAGKIFNRRRFIR